MHWQVLCTISHCDYDRLPRFLLEVCFNVIRKQKVKNPDLRNEANASILVRKLVEHGMCTKIENGKFVTFNEDVFKRFSYQDTLRSKL